MLAFSCKRGISYIVLEGIGFSVPTAIAEQRTGVCCREGMLNNQWYIAPVSPVAETLYAMITEIFALKSCL